MGVGSSSLVSNPAWDVPVCCWERAEGGRAYGPLGPLRQHIRTWPRCWSLCHGISGIPDLLQGIYHSVYLLRRPLGLPSCGDQLRRRTICNILSSLTGWLHQHRYPATTREDPESEEEWLPKPNRRESYEEALRTAHQRMLDTAKVLQGNIKRLSWRMRDTSWTHSRSYSRSHARSRGRSQSRSHSRAHSQSHPQSMWPRSPSGPLPGRRVTFREPEVEPTLKEVWGLPTRTSCFRHGDMAWVAGLPAEHPSMVVRAHRHSRGEGPVKTCLQDSGLLLYPWSIGWGPTWSRNTLCPLPPNASTEILSSWIN